MTGPGDRIRVGILAATGTVGQRFVQLLEGHPQFVVTALAASDRSVGKAYREACTWRLPGEMSRDVSGLVVRPPRPPLDCDVIFSSLPADVGREVEAEFAQAGYPVISNSSSFRMEADVPLLIPEVNPDHLALLDRRPAKGFIVTNPNCSAIVIALALAPLERRFGVEAAVVTTLQALSGAGYPGVPSLDVTDNVLPYIANEEEKIERETRKILGVLKDGAIADAPLAVSAQCHRVPVQDGHLAAIRVKLSRRAEPGEVREALASFTGEPQALRLHSAPARPRPAAAAARPRRRRWHDRDRGPSVPGRGARLSLRGARPQHDPGGRGRGDPERGAARGERVPRRTTRTLIPRQ